MLTKRDLLGFFQFLRGYAGLFYLVNDLQRQVFGSFALFRIESGIDSKQSRISRRVRKRRNTKCETGFFAHAPIKPRTAPIAENSGEQIESGNVGTCDLRDVPGHREMCQLRRKFAVDFSPAKLWR